MNGIPNAVLIFKNQFPYKSVATVAEASRLTLVPNMTIKRMIDAPLKKKDDKRNGGRTSPDGWGFDYLFVPED